MCSTGLTVQDPLLGNQHTCPNYATWGYIPTEITPSQVQTNSNWENSEDMTFKFNDCYW